MILDEIVAKRIEQLEREKAAVSQEEMKKLAEAMPFTRKSFRDALKGEEMSFICEAKKASPSKGVICPDFRPVETAETYEKSGAAAISCLTEEHYFMGSSEYLKAISEKVEIPVLRKDFIIDEYQIYEAKTIGASAVLLIAAILSEDKLKRFKETAEEQGLQCLVEVHNEEELEKVLKVGAEIIGVNNRNLKTFEVSLETTERLAKLVPKDLVLVSESGIKTHEDIKRLAACGAKAVLVGETLMRSGNIAETLRNLKEGV